MNYKNFPNFIVRTPINSLDKIKNININLEFFINNNELLQAIRLASPSLYNEYIKWQKQGLKNKKDEERLLYSMLKYYTRSCMRCTPFGLFAGLCIGKISDINAIVLQTIKHYKPHTRLDMSYLSTLITTLEKNPKIRKQLTYSVNTSLYVVGDKLRYVEYFYYNGYRKHQITGTENNVYIQKVISRAKNSATIDELVNVLINSEISYEEATYYINQLIDNQVLISNLEPTVTGIELQESLSKKIANISFDKKIKNTLIKVKNLLLELDSLPIGNGINLYSKITKCLKGIDVEFEEKYLFQTDLISATEENTIDCKLVANLRNALKLINKLTIVPNETNITMFRDAFHERYDEQEILLAIALDTEVGIGYIQNNSSSTGDNTPLVDDLILPFSKKHKKSSNLNWDSKQNFLLKKYLEAIKNNEKIVEITDDEVEHFEENWDDLPSTFSANTQIVYLDGEYKIIVDGAGGSSAINLLGRFAHADNKIHKYINEIIKKEETLERNVIHAEIVHLPESRVGNILARPNFRKYEIPYLAQSSVETENQIPIEDLLISVKNNRIVLRSKKLNKEVVPHLSCAHNFSLNSLPIYQFLANMQTSNIKRNGIKFTVGSLLSGFDYIPRIVYKNIILNLATWIIKTDELQEILKLKNDNVLFEQFSKIKEKRKLPKDVILSDGDNKIYINLNNMLNIKMLLSLVKSRPYFKLKEFLFSDKNGLVKDINKNTYVNEVIFSFYKDEANKQ